MQSDSNTMTPAQTDTEYPITDEAKFRITWRDAQYRVDIPNYGGGYVVPAEIAESLELKLSQAVKVAGEALEAYVKADAANEAFKAYCIACAEPRGSENREILDMDKYERLLNEVNSTTESARELRDKALSELNASKT